MKNMSNLNVKQRQTYLKKIGLYKDKVDGIAGKNTKKAYKDFNITFLNASTEKYTTLTDNKLRVVYKSYCGSQYMTADDWKLFPNFKESEFKCTCKGKYCDGYNGKYKKCPMKLIMCAQYIRNYYDKPLHITSGVRDKKRNAEVGGIKTSKHLDFKAMDFKVGSYKASQIIKTVKAFPLVAYIYAINTNYIHINI